MGSTNITTVVEKSATFGILNFSNINGNPVENDRNSVNATLIAQDKELSNWKFENELNMSKIRFACIVTIAVVSLVAMIIKTGSTWNEARRLRKELADLVGDIEAPATNIHSGNRRNEGRILMARSPPPPPQHIASPHTNASAPPPPVDTTRC